MPSIILGLKRQIKSGSMIYTLRSRTALNSGNSSQNSFPALASLPIAAIIITSGPSINILIKLMSMVSIVFAGLIVAYSPKIEKLYSGKKKEIVHVETTESASEFGDLLYKQAGENEEVVEEEK